MQLKLVKIRDSVSRQIDVLKKTLGTQGRRQVLLSVGREFIQEAQSNFGGKSSVFKDGIWPPLSKQYAKKVGHTSSTLEKTGALRNSIRMDNPLLNYITVYTKNPYAATHMLGSSKLNVPKRNFFPVEFQGGNANRSRLVWNSQLRITFEIGKRFHQISGGILPIPSYFQQRMTYEIGNPFNGPQPTSR